MKNKIQELIKQLQDAIKISDTLDINKVINIIDRIESYASDTRTEIDEASTRIEYASSGIDNIENDLYALRETIEDIRNVKQENDKENK